MGQLDSRHVVVIGGSSGIGFAVARRALAEGATVTIGSSNPDKLAAAQARLGEGVSAHPVNVRDEASVEQFFDATGTLDHLVYTAGDWGGARGTHIADLDLAAAADVFAVRFWGALAAVRHGLAHIDAAGSITLTDGGIAHRPRPGAVLSTAMAGAIEHLTRGLAVELAPLRVNCVCPGYVETEVWDSMSADARAAFLHKATARQPLPRAAAPAELAESYLYAMLGTFATGQVLIADGGMSLI